MCSADHAWKSPEDRLSNIIDRELGVKIDKAALRIFIRAHWQEVAPLAHAIHGPAKAAG